MLYSGTLLFICFEYNSLYLLSYWCFHLNFPSGIWYLSSFHMCICYLCIFWWGIFSDLLPLFNRLFSYCWILIILCVFWRSTFYQICVLQIFSWQKIWVLFLYLAVSFAKLKFPTQSIFSSVDCVFLMQYLKMKHQIPGHVDFFFCFLL